jgi:hypothetical protein
MESSNYTKRLFELLPQLYQIYDRGDGTLEKFLQAVGATLDDMERNIEELYDDSFIESCHEWVIPYIGQIIGARLLNSGGVQNRLEVMKTIQWRKRKGNLEAMEDIAADLTGWGVRAAEFFEQLGWSQNLNHLKLDHLQSPDLSDHNALFKMGTADNTILNTIDLRKPGEKEGWFQIKNIGFFLSTALLSHYKKIPMHGIFAQPLKFSLVQEHYVLDLFDGESKFPLSETNRCCDLLNRFGLGLTVDIFSRGILAATPQMPEWKGPPSILPPHSDILNFKENSGVTPVDLRDIQEEPLQYTITPMVLYQTGNKAKLKELGDLDLSASPFKFKKTFDGSSKTGGRLIMRVKPHAGYNRSFPGIILRLQSKNKTFEVFPDDRTCGIYQDRMYCYIPGFDTTKGKSKYFAIDRYGSAYEYIHDGTKKQPSDDDLYDFTKLKRSTQGVVFPSRKLTASSNPYHVLYSLNKNNPISIVDRGQFLPSIVPSGGWEISAFNRDNQPSGGILRLLSSVNVKSAAGKPAVTPVENNSLDKQGHLIIRLRQKANITGRIPEMEIIVTTERGESLLIYLPQIDNLDTNGAFFYVADDGATYRVNGDSISGGGILVSRTPLKGPGGAFNKELLGKYSAGQVLPMEGKSPLCHRIPVRCDLDSNNEVSPGLLAIDPRIGWIGFADDELPEMPMTAGFYHGMSTYLGAGAYLRELEPVEEERLIRVSKYCAPDNTRHVRPNADGIIPRANIYFGSISDAIVEAIKRNKLAAQGKPLVIQIDDSEIYDDDIVIKESISRGLIIRAAQFQKPFWNGSLQWKIPAASKDNDVVTGLLSLEGLEISRSPEIKNGRFQKISFRDCTLLNERLIINDKVKGAADRYPKLVIDNCIVRDRISVHGYCEIEIENSALDPAVANTEALVADKGMVSIISSTVTGKVAAKELFASESIFSKAVVVQNNQKGCVRYCRLEEAGNVLPYAYKCTKAPVTFCSTLPFVSSYLKVKRVCDQPAAVWAENGGEIGVHHRADYTRKQKNLTIKFNEYLPAGLTPVLIDTGNDAGINMNK